MSAGRAWLGSLSTNVGNLFVGLVTGVLTARLLLPAGRGELAEILFWGQTVAALGLFAIPSALVMEMAQNKKDNTLVANALVLSLVLAAGSIAVFLPLSDRVVQASTYNGSIIFLLCFVPINSVSQILVAVDQGREHFGRYNLLRLIPQSVYLLLLLLLWWSGYISAAYCVFATWIGSLVIVIIRLPRAWRETGWRITSSRMLSLLRRGTSFHLAFLSSILLQRADQFVIVTWFDHKALGLYAVAMTASGVALGTVTGATTAILLPISGPHNRSRRASTKNTYSLGRDTIGFNSNECRYGCDCALACARDLWSGLFGSFLHCCYSLCGADTAGVCFRCIYCTARRWRLALWGSRAAHRPMYFCSLGPAAYTEHAYEGCGSRPPTGMAWGVCLHGLARFRAYRTEADGLSHAISK